MSNCSREAEVCRICCRIGQLEGAILRTLVAPEGLFPGVSGRYVGLRPYRGFCTVGSGSRNGLDPAQLIFWQRSEGGVWEELEAW